MGTGDLHEIGDRSSKGGHHGTPPKRPILPSSGQNRPILPFWRAIWDDFVPYCPSGRAIWDDFGGGGGSNFALQKGNMGRFWWRGGSCFG